MQNDLYDIIVIGGGATGAGIALDAALRGFSVALFERNDFAEGTSSRSTKLVHGGVRYLEAAVKHLDRKQYELVKEGLRERKIFLRNAPHLAHPIELITPLYRWYELPYIYAGLLLYDLISRDASLGRSRLLTPQEALKRCPGIDPRGLKGAVSYYDGAFNDSRMVIALLQSAEELGAKPFNYHAVEGLLEERGEIRGVRVKERTGGEELEYRAGIVINAAGPYCDEIRRMEDPNARPLLVTSRGTHIVLDRRFLPSKKGLMIPKTADGRLLFALPWEGHCLIGTTDIPSPPEARPLPGDEEIEYLIEHANRYFDIEITQADILASFSGLRPLVRKPGVDSTAKLRREYLTELSPKGLLTVTGGKWTSYRTMAEHTVDLAAKALGEPPEKRVCKTKNYKVVGSRKEKRQILRQLRDFGMDDASADYLYRHYGDRSPAILQIAQKEELKEPIHPAFEALRAEIPYTIRHEYVRKPLDFLARRCNLAMEERAKALEALPAVAELMARELHWSDARRTAEESEARSALTKGF